MSDSFSTDPVCTSIILTDLLIFSGKIFKQKNKISIYDLDLQVFEDKNPIIKIENLNFANYGYNKNIICPKYIQIFSLKNI